MTNPLKCLAVTAALLLPAPAALAAQHGPRHDASDQGAALRLGLHAVPLLTAVRPILAGEGRSEVYLTQPTLFTGATLAGGRLRLRAAISFEPLTLERGELGAGLSGEGYVDRRHPHTYLHELVVSAEGRLGALGASLAAGRGFVPFGTDDPMMRPFAKFPANHHLAQVLERSLVAGALAAGSFIFEAAAFQGTEPLAPDDLGSLDRFADSWSGRVTLLPRPGLELQASHARVTSPEMPRGEGPDQRKWSASARYRGTVGGGELLALAEWALSTEAFEGQDGFSWSGVLAEAQLERGAWRPALRLEITERPEEVRTFDPFRAPWPHADAHLMGVTRWTTVAARLERGLAWKGLRARPFGEVSLARVAEVGEGPFDPVAFYGARHLWTFNVGARLGAGWHPERMGRYGAAEPPR